MEISIAIPGIKHTKTLSPSKGQRVGRMKKRVKVCISDLEVQHEIGLQMTQSYCINKVMDGVCVSMCEYWCVCLGEEALEKRQKGRDKKKLLFSLRISWGKAWIQLVYLGIWPYREKVQDNEGKTVQKETAYMQTFIWTTGHHWTTLFWEACEMSLRTVHKGE